MPYPSPSPCPPFPSSNVAAAVPVFVSQPTGVIPLTSTSTPSSSSSSAACAAACTATPSTVNQAPISTPLASLAESAAAAAPSTSVQVLPSTSTAISTTLGSSAAAVVVPSTVTKLCIRIPRPSCPTITPPGLPVTGDLETLESQNFIAAKDPKDPNPSNCNADTSNITPGHQLTLDNFDSHGIRPRRTRKANILNLNACICGVTITDHEIQNGEGIMKCRVSGCETVWVSTVFSCVF